MGALQVKGPAAKVLHLNGLIVSLLFVFVKQLLLLVFYILNIVYSLCVMNKHSCYIMMLCCVLCLKTTQAPGAHVRW